MVETTAIASATTRAEIEAVTSIIWPALNIKEESKVSHEQYMAYINHIFDLTAGFYDTSDEKREGFKKMREEFFDPANP